MTHENLLFIETSIAPHHLRGGLRDSLEHRLPGGQFMITDRFISLRPIRHSSCAGRLTVRTAMGGCLRHRQAACSLAEEAFHLRADDIAWGWRQVACFLVVLLVAASMTYLYAQMAAAFLQNFNQPVSLGSEWEALASRNGPITSLPRDWPFP